MDLKFDKTESRGRTQTQRLERNFRSFAGVSKRKRSLGLLNAEKKSCRRSGRRQSDGRDTVTKPGGHRGA